MKKDFKKISDISTVDVLKDSGIENLTNGSGSDGSGSDGSGSDGSGSDGSGSDGSGSDSGSGSDGSGSDSGSGSDPTQGKVDKDFWHPSVDKYYGTYDTYHFKVNLNVDYKFTIEADERFCFNEIDTVLWIEGDTRIQNNIKYSTKDQNVRLLLPVGGNNTYLDGRIKLHAPYPEIVDGNGNTIDLYLYYRIQFCPKDKITIFECDIR